MEDKKQPVGITRFWYALLCCAQIGAAYFVFMATWWGDPMHGPGGWHIVAREAVLVLAAYSTVELYRRRITFWPIGLPFVLLLPLEMYWRIAYWLKWEILL